MSEYHENHNSILLSGIALLGFILATISITNPYKYEAEECFKLTSSEEVTPIVCIVDSVDLVSGRYVYKCPVMTDSVFSVDMETGSERIAVLDSTTTKMPCDSVVSKR